MNGERKEFQNNTTGTPQICQNNAMFTDSIVYGQNPIHQLHSRT